MLHFWDVLESFTLEQRRQFLRFVWGRGRLPPGGEARCLELQPLARTVGSTAAGLDRGPSFSGWATMSGGVSGQNLSHNTLAPR